jgi:hypothetical protein
MHRDSNSMMIKTSDQQEDPIRPNSEGTRGSVIAKNVDTPRGAFLWSHLEALHGRGDLSKALESVARVDC